MKQAIEEGFILDVLQNYTTYDTFYQINKEIEEDPRCKTADAKRQIARFVELHETNIAQRVEVIVEHFRITVQSGWKDQGNEFHAEEGRRTHQAGFGCKACNEASDSGEFRIDGGEGRTPVADHSGDQQQNRQSLR